MLMIWDGDRKGAYLRVGDDGLAQGADGWEQRLTGQFLRDLDGL